MTVFKAFNHFSSRHARARLRYPCFPCPQTHFPICVSSVRLYSGISDFYSLLASSASHPSSIMEVFKAVSRQGSTSINSMAVHADGKRYSYRELISSAQKISSLLRGGDIKSKGANQNNAVQETGSLDGVRVGIVAKPSAEFVAAVLGTWLWGGVAVPLALSYPETELLHVMNDSDISVVLSTEDHRGVLQAVAAKSEAHFSVIPPVSSHSENGKLENSDTQATDVPCKIREEDAALILYTSGTTGKPKGVVHTHGSILAQVQMLKEAWGYTNSDQFLHCLPLHHVHGLFNALFAPLFAGSTVQFMPKFSVSGIWQRWRDSYPKDGSKADDAVTVFTGVPTMYTRLIQGYEAMDQDLQSASAAAAKQLRLMMCGSSALPYPVMQQWEMITGHRLLERYGMTEFVMAISNPLHGLRKGGTVGKPLPGVEAKILAEDGSGNESTGVGELCIRSPALFREYWKLPKVTKESFIDGGFFKTGDAVKVDEDGYYVILGRTSADIMKVGGYKLSALEIEAVLLEHPVASECCVLGLPDETYGEAVCAIIVPHEHTRKQKQEELQPAITLEELRAWAKERLAPYKLPTRLYLWDSLPRNAMGKVNKKELKKSFAEKEAH